jgi:hypothetical protein
LLGRFSPSGTWGKSSEPSTAVKAGNPRNQGMAGCLYWTANATWAEVNLIAPRLFSSQLSATSFLKLSPLSDLTHLGGGPKTVGGKKSFSSSYESALAAATPW